MTVLSTGHSGPEVQLLQKALRRSGDYKGELDGQFGPATAAAVRGFQKRGGLKADGIAGAATWRALTPYLNRTVRHTVQKGETLGGIANKYKVGINDLLYANPFITDSNYIFPGLRLTVPWPGSVVNSDISYSSGVLLSDLGALEARYSFLQRGSAGKSVMGTDIPYMRFGQGSKKVAYNAAHHANEWITSPVLMRFLERLCQMYVQGGTLAGQSVRGLFDSVSLYVVPMVNPDGVDLVTGQIQPGSKAYQDAYAIRGELPFPQSWKANIKGIDLNNNYPALFEVGKEEKAAIGIDSPAPRDFPGPYALSEPESAGMAAITKELSPRLTVALHTQGEEIYWRFNDIMPPDGRRIGEEMAQVSGYTLADPQGNSYGGYKDWFIQTYNRPGYTAELGKGVNPLPISQFDEIYRDAEGIMMVGMVQAP